MLFAPLFAMLLLQDAPAGQVQKQADGTQSWSILADPCASASKSKGDDIVVCGQGAAPSPRIPLPDERTPPDRPMPSNPDASGVGALAATDTPCAARMGGCTTGVDILGGATFLVRGAGKIINPNSCCDEPGEATNPVSLVNDIGSVVKRTFKKKPDKSKRVPILLDGPSTATGRVVDRLPEKAPAESATEPAKATP